VRLVDYLKRKVLSAYAQHTSIPHLFVMIQTFINYGLLNKTMLKKHFTTRHYTCCTSIGKMAQFTEIFIVIIRKEMVLLYLFLATSSVSRMSSIYLSSIVSHTETNQTRIARKVIQSSVHLIHDCNYKQLSKINTICTYSANPIIGCYLHEDYLKAIHYLPILISI
jgi:hypothetical protein